MKKFLTACFLTVLTMNFSNAEVTQSDIVKIKKNTQNIANQMSQEKIDNVKRLKSAILDLYDYEGYFHIMKIKLSSGIGTNKPSVRCFANNISSELYQQYLTGKIAQYINITSTKKINADIVLLKNQKLHTFYQASGEIWENSLTPSYTLNQENLNDVPHTQLKALAKDKNFLKQLDKLNHTEKLGYLINLPMTVDETKNSIVAEFTTGVGVACSSNPNIDLKTIFQ